MKAIITCEHGGNKIPREYFYLFKDRINILETHEGYDLGALGLAKEISKKNGDYFCYSEISRLLVDLNRSIKHPKLFSGYTKDLNKNEKSEILKKFYFPYRKKVENLIRELISENDKIIHMSIHSFTPILKHKMRNADVGILYNPKRKAEKDFASLFKNELFLSDNNLKIRFNYPYLGISDGLTTYLKKKFNQKNYIGIEVEVNQKFILHDKNKWKEIKRNLSESLNSILRR